ncbi:MAG: TolC family protein [Chitinispirillaceae bacterium]|nr:TolC family protein [Chitinispirillaceae bacterium]
MKEKIVFMICIAILILNITSPLYAEGKIVRLKWEDVVIKSSSDNLEIKRMQLEYDIQKLNKWQSISNFLPTLTLNSYFTKNIELPTITMNGMKFKMGSPYNIQAELELSLPIFTGLSRYANLRVQQILEKSVKTELKGKEEEVVQKSLQAYFQVILAKKLIEVHKEALNAAKANLAQVEHLYNAGTASELDLTRAKARYSSALPMLESAFNNFKIAQNYLKTLLNIPLEDSLEILDSLEQKNFLDEDITKMSLDELKKISLENRIELKKIDYQIDIMREQKLATLSQHLPVVALATDVSEVAMKQSLDNISRNDFSRSRTLSFALKVPIIDGGKTVLQYKKAQIQIKQLQYTKEQIYNGIMMEVEQDYYALLEAKNSLSSLEASFEQVKEALRLATLMYAEGMSTQVDVLDAQTMYTKSSIEYQKGLYDYNIAQINLLKALGKIETIFK